MPRSYIDLRSQWLLPRSQRLRHPPPQQFTFYGHQQGPYELQPYAPPPPGMTSVLITVTILLTVQLTTTTKCPLRLGMNRRKELRRRIQTNNTLLRRDRREHWDRLWLSDLHAPALPLQFLQSSNRHSR